MNIVYTAIFGNYDKLWKPNIISEGWEYICFTDQNLKSDIWKIYKINKVHDDTAKSSRFIKVNLLPSDNQIVLWIDGCVEIRKDLNEFVKLIPDNYNIAVQKHPCNNSIKGEFIACKNLKKDNENIMAEQISRYTLIEPYIHTMNNIVFKRGDVEKAMLIWWNEINIWSKRDQLSFVWAMQQANQEYYAFSNSIANEYFKWWSRHPT